jgi:cysteine synthase
MNNTALPYGSSIGNTPLAEVDGVLAKMECVNPCGSIKDRIAEYILTKSIERGLLRPGMRIVEATSGNTGISMAYFGKKMGFDVVIVMPENMTEERRELIRGIGAELILCSAEGSFTEAAQIRDDLAQDPSYFNPDQFSNPLNVECHRLTTGQEILDQLPDGMEPKAFVAGVGTGGTLIGVGLALRARFPAVRIVAVEPSESPVMSGGLANQHGIYGIGDGFVPALAGDGKGGLNPLIDQVVTVASDEAVTAANDLRRSHGLCVGVSSGANYLAAQAVRAGSGTVITIFADGFSKYASCGLESASSPGCPFRDRCPEPIPFRQGK